MKIVVAPKLQNKKRKINLKQGLSQQYFTLVLWKHAMITIIFSKDTCFSLDNKRLLSQFNYSVDFMSLRLPLYELLWAYC